jgi:hypothetical protein
MILRAITATSLLVTIVVVERGHADGNPVTPFVPERPKFVHQLVGYKMGISSPFFDRKMKNASCCCVYMMLLLEHVKYVVVIVAQKPSSIHSSARHHVLL